MKELKMIKRSRKTRIHIRTLSMSSRASTEKSEYAQTRLRDTKTDMCWCRRSKRNRNKSKLNKTKSYSCMPVKSLSHYNDVRHYTIGVLRFSALDSTSIGVLRLSGPWAAVFWPATTAATEGVPVGDEETLSGRTSANFPPLPKKFPSSLVGVLL